MPSFAWSEDGVVKYASNGADTVVFASRNQSGAFMGLNDGRPPTGG